MEFPFELQCKMQDALEAYKNKCDAETVLAQRLAVETQQRIIMTGKFDSVVNVFVKMFDMVEPYMDKLEPVIKAQLEVAVEQMINPTEPEAEPEPKPTCVVCFTATVDTVGDVCPTCVSDER